MTSLSERWFQFGNYIFLTLLSITFILPFLLLLSTSFVSEQELIRRGTAFVLLPHEINFAAYEVLFSRGSQLFKAYGITLFIVIIGTFLNLLFTSMLAYGLANRHLPGRTFFTTMVFLTMVFSGGLIPNYLLVTFLGLKNTLWALIIPGLISVWLFLILRHFFINIPESLEESASIDGATPPYILWKIVLPLSLPALATVGLFYAVGHWNAWFGAAIYIHTPDLMPLQILLRNVVVNQTSQDLNVQMITDMDMFNKPPEMALRSATIIVSTLPILMTYPFLQKYFIKGVMVGSIKG